jgi:hypothetical protein
MPERCANQIPSAHREPSRLFEVLDARDACFSVWLADWENRCSRPPQPPGESICWRNASARSPRRSSPRWSSSTRVAFSPSGMNRISTSVLRSGSKVQSAPSCHLSSKRWRVQDENLADFAFDPVDAAFEPASAFPRLNDRRVEVRGPDVMCSRPPAADAGGKYLECPFARRTHTYSRDRRRRLDPLPGRR